MSARITLKDRGDEIAGGALYLASGFASYLTGHTIVIDAGMAVA